MAQKKEVIGGPLEINGRVLSLSRAIRAGDFVFLTGQMKNMQKEFVQYMILGRRVARYIQQYWTNMIWQ